MAGNFVDNIWFSKRTAPMRWGSDIELVATDYGRIRVLDTKENKPVIINVPDAPNVIEHHLELVNALRGEYRVVCFEFPGVGFSYPSTKYDYSLDNGAGLIVNIMAERNIARASLLFSCGNGFYAVRAAQLYPDKFNYLFLSQTPSFDALIGWSDKSIPKIIKTPLLGQIVNLLAAKKIANIWYEYALPEGDHRAQFQDIARESLNKGGCFCLSSLFQSLSAETSTALRSLEIPSTMVWGAKDYSHRHTDNNTITTHLPNCEIIEFKECGHFPELEATSQYVRLIDERLENFTTTN